MLLIWVINLFGQSTVKYIMNLSTIGKLLALGLVILAGAFYYYLLVKIILVK